MGGDVADYEALTTALAGAEVAYYLVHSLDSADFADKDADGARTFGQAAREAGVGESSTWAVSAMDGDDLSAHLKSRQEVEELLGEAGSAR